MSGMFIMQHGFFDLSKSREMCFPVSVDPNEDSHGRYREVQTCDSKCKF